MTDPFTLANLGIERLTSLKNALDKDKSLGNTGMTLEQLKSLANDSTSTNDVRAAAFFGTTPSSSPTNASVFPETTGYAPPAPKKRYDRRILGEMTVDLVTAHVQKYGLPETNNGREKAIELAMDLSKAIMDKLEI